MPCSLVGLRLPTATARSCGICGKQSVSGAGFLPASSHSTNRSAFIEHTIIRRSTVSVQRASLNGQNQVTWTSLSMNPMLGIHLCPEDGGSPSLRNVCKRIPDLTVLPPRSQHNVPSHRGCMLHAVASPVTERDVIWCGLWPPITVRGCLILSHDAQDRSVKLLSVSVVIAICWPISHVLSPPVFTLVSWSAYFSTLKMVIYSFETSVNSERTTLRYIPEDGTLHSF
jgi:hypothetical protein